MIAIAPPTFTPACPLELEIGELPNNWHIPCAHSRGPFLQISVLLLLFAQGGKGWGGGGGGGGKGRFAKVFVAFKLTEILFRLKVAKFLVTSFRTQDWGHLVSQWGKAWYATTTTTRVVKSHT